MFFKKKNKPGLQEEVVLWKADQSRTKKTEPRERSSRLYNLPVSPDALAGHGKIYTVQSSTKGDGASTIAVNLAALLALSNPERVVLIDLDGYGSIRSRMGLPADECLVNILDWEDIHGRDSVRGLYNHSSGIMVVPGVIHHDQEEKVNPALIFKMLTLLKETYDYIILDCPPVGTGNNTWAAALVSDLIVTVFSPDRVSLDLINVNSGFMARLGCQDRVCLVLNQAGIPGGIRAGELESRLTDILGIMPYSVAVAEENNRRRMMVHSRERDDFVKALQVLAKRLPAQGKAV